MKGRRKTKVQLSNCLAKAANFFDWNICYVDCLVMNIYRLGLVLFIGLGLYFSSYLSKKIFLLCAETPKSNSGLILILRTHQDTIFHSLVRWIVCLYLPTWTSQVINQLLSDNRHTHTWDQEGGGDIHSGTSGARSSWHSTTQVPA
jgi:hypothetical protein